MDGSFAVMTASLPSLAEVAELLSDARKRTRLLADDLRDEDLIVPMLEVVNPPLWELGHVAYFAEFWTLRHLGGRPPILPQADDLYDSARIPHDARWSLPLPSRDETFAYLDRQLEAVLERLARDHSHDLERERYFHLLALYHEDMHGEAALYTRQTLGYRRPPLPRHEAPQAEEPVGDAHVPAGRYTIGARPNDGFVFDNEKWAHEVELDAFEIARAPVTNEAYLAFVEDGGYRTRRYWSDDGWAWRERTKAEHPVYWRRTGSGRGIAAWQRRHFDAWIPLRPHEPVVHVNRFEAEAYCAWAGRRLPTEAEWEVAATGGDGRRYPWGDEPPSPDRANLDAWYGDVVDVGAFPNGESPFGVRQMIGNVWEWTASSFEPYPGFSPDPYKEYSQPWFGTHVVLRGGAWTTRARLVTARWRNFYRPHRTDVVTGFRTCRK